MYFILHDMKSHLRFYQPVIGDPIIVQHDSDFVLGKVAISSISPAVSPALLQVNHCEKCTKVYLILNELVRIIPDDEPNTSIKKEMLKIIKKLTALQAHFVRCVHAERHYHELFRHLLDDQIGIIAAYKIKWVLRQYRETDIEWYEKRGLSCHGYAIFVSTKLWNDTVAAKLKLSGA